MESQAVRGIGGSMLAGAHFTIDLSERRRTNRLDDAMTLTF